MKKEYFVALNTLEALYFFTDSLEGKALEDITKMRPSYDRLGRKGKRHMLQAIQRDIRMLRDHYGAIASNSTFRQLMEEASARAEGGYTYLQKLHIDTKLFRNYEKVFPRWPNVKLHDWVVFDAKTKKRLSQIFTVEGAVYSDSQIFLANARDIFTKAQDFRSRGYQDQINLLANLRAAAALIFHFLEAYLNGLAYDCFMTHHDRLPIDEHDMLGEWDSSKKQRKYVSFEKKVFRYPVIVGKVDGRTIDISGCKAAHLLTNEGKELRDALTHPSPYVDLKTGEFKKTTLVAAIKYPLVESLFGAAREYVLTIEKSLGKDPEQTVPWLLK